jgi:hypothetical protein
MLLEYPRGNLSEKRPATITHHAMLVAWGLFAQNIGLIGAIESIALHQKEVVHSPQTKVLEFFVAILAGLPHLQELSRSAHPIDQDQAVAKAWLQASWADYSGVSRTLSGIRQAEADQIAKVMQQITQPILAEEVMQALKRSDRLVYAGDLTARPVSNTSTSYPGVAYDIWATACIWDIKQPWLVCTAPTMVACGCRSWIIRAIRFPVRKQKQWFMRLKHALGCVPGAEPIS